MGFASHQTLRDIEVLACLGRICTARFVLLGVAAIPGAAYECAYRVKDKPPGASMSTTPHGSGVASARALIAVMETYQQQDGSKSAVPDVLSWLNVFGSGWSAAIA